MLPSGVPCKWQGKTLSSWDFYGDPRSLMDLYIYSKYNDRGESVGTGCWHRVMNDSQLDADRSKQIEFHFKLSY